MKTSNLCKAAAIHSITIALILGFTANAVTAHADELALFKAVDTWQMNRLFKPSPEQRSYERRGDVVIYDGLTDIKVELALNQNFERIQNMMFTRVVLTGKNGKPQRDADGQVVTLDDGC
jgi:hypothetical protein